MIATHTVPSQDESVLALPEVVSEATVESALWEALELDDLSDEMMHGKSGSIQMGTGHTVNACNQCSNSNTTHGCGTCR
jgi:hypothetical protein